MSEIPELAFDHKLFIDKSIVLYGASDTGKSTIIKDVMWYLNPYIDQGIVFCKSEDSSSTYEGILPRALTFTKLTEERLLEIWDRQTVFASVYKIANNIKTLTRLAMKTGDEIIKTHIIKANLRKKELISAIEKSDKDAAAKKKRIEVDCENFSRALCKSVIRTHRKQLLKMQLSDNEEFSLEHLDFNPRLLLIFDDCAADIKKLQNNPIMDDFFTQGRHRYITIFVSVQDDKYLPSEWRKNGFVNIFTTRQCATALFTRASNSYDKSLIRRSMDACKEVFALPFQKLLYIRKNDAFFKVTATEREPFEFGSDVINTYCKTIQNEGICIPQNNKYSKYFQKKKK